MLESIDPSSDSFFLMDFFKSVFSDQPPPSIQAAAENPDRAGPNSNSPWNFGGLVKTLSTRSESVIQTYRRDLQEFGSGLKKETAAIRDLGSSVLRGTAEIISHGKDAILSADADSDCSREYGSRIVQIQTDPSTYCKEPEDAEDFKKWKSDFSFEEKRDEIERLIGNNGVMEGVYRDIVPEIVDNATFWSRYFYKIHCLECAEDARLDLAKRDAELRKWEEDLSWEINDDNGKDENVVIESNYRASETRELEKNKMDSSCKVDNDNEEDANVAMKLKNEAMQDRELVKKDKNLSWEEDNGIGAVTEVGESSNNKTSEKEELEKKEIFDSMEPEVDKRPFVVGRQQGDVGSVELNTNELMGKSSGKLTLEEKVKPSELSRESDAHEDYEIGWDDIEDLGSIDENKVNASSGRSTHDELRKRLTAVEEDEDLSWDIEDD